MKYFRPMILSILLTGNLSGQTLEEWIQSWVQDGPSAFENVAESHSESSQQTFGKLLEKYGRSEKGTGHFYANLELASSADLKRKGLHSKFHAVKKAMEGMSFFHGWKITPSLGRYFGSVRYEGIDGGGRFVCELALKERDELEVVALSLQYEGPAKNLKAAESWEAAVGRAGAAVTVLEASPLGFNQDIRALITQPVGAQAFTELLAAAENDFVDIKGAATGADEEFLVRSANALNPAAPDPHLIIVDKGQMRIELHIRFVELYGSQGWRLDPKIKSSLATILGPEWIVQEGNEPAWSASLRDGRQYKSITTRSKNNREFLVVEVIKEPFRNLIEDYPQLLEGNCIEGDCVDGRGTFVFQEEPFYSIRYEGDFKDGQYDGIGFVYRKNRSNDGIGVINLDHFSDDEDQLLFVGHHKAGKREGKGMSYAYARYKDPYRNFRDESEYFFPGEQTEIFYYLFQEYKDDVLVSEKLRPFVYFSPPSQVAIRIDRPFTTAFGECLTGDCEDGFGVLEMEGLGEYEGQFVDGMAHGNGLLKLPTGEYKSFELYQGIPLYGQTLKLPEGVSRVDAALRNVWLLADFDCLEGDCYEGEGLRLRVNADRFRRNSLPYIGFLSAQFENGVAQGEFQIRPLRSPDLVVEGDMKNGVFDGTIDVFWPDEKHPREEYYVEGRRVTETGQDFGEYMAEEYRKWKANYEQQLKEARAEGIALRQQREREARRKETATEQSFNPRQPRNGLFFCQTCNGKGSYWSETTTQDCTITYDYTFSSGVYYQTETRCRDVTSGNYEICGVCNGQGRYKL